MKEGIKELGKYESDGFWAWHVFENTTNMRSTKRYTIDTEVFEEIERQSPIGLILRHSGHYDGPGNWFCNGPVVRINKNRILVKSCHLMDI